MLHQIQRSGTVLESACHEDSELSLIFRIDKELTELFKVEDKAPFPKSQ